MKYMEIKYPQSIFRPLQLVLNWHISKGTKQKFMLQIFFLHKTIIKITVIVQLLKIMSSHLLGLLQWLVHHEPEKCESFFFFFIVLWESQ